METRGRKRADTTSAAPSTAAPKRARRSTTTAVSSADVTGNLPVSTRSLGLNDLPVQMDSTNDSSSSAGRGGGRRCKNRVLGSEKDSSDKGKEKEHEVRVRGRELALNSDNNGENDYINDIDSAGILHQNLTTANSALQGLLKKLGTGLDDLLPSSALVGSISHQSGKIKKMLTGLRANCDDGKQIEALTQLCEMLSIGTEVSLSTFSVDSFVPVLVGLLSRERNPDIMLLAARALTHLCDVLPSSCALVVQYGAVSHFCARLLTIEYMDLAEQSLQALKKISVEHPTVCLRAGALMAVLSYLDFFSTGVQRVALATAADICNQLPSDAADFVMEAVPVLTNLLQNHDSKVLEHASDCLTRIAEAFASSPDKIAELCNHGLLSQAASLISISNSGGGQTSIDTSAYTGLIRLLSTCASGSPLCSNALLLLGISGILKDILSVSDNSASMFVSPALSRPQNQIFEIVNLVNGLLPPLPQGIITLPASSKVFLRRSFIKESSASSSAKQEYLNSNISPGVSAREKLLTEQPEILQQFGKDIFPILIQIYGSSVNVPVRHKCLSVIGKFMYFSNADMIQSLLSVTNISSFVAGVLAWKDPYVLIPALQIAEILMEKLPEIFSKMFLREGVVHAIVALVLPKFSTEKDKDYIPEGASRTRQNRRRIGNSNSDVNSREESRSSVSVSFSSPPSSIKIPSVNLNIRTAVSAKAKAFKDKYFPSDAEDVEVGVTEDLLHLKSLCMKLSSDVDDQKIKSKGKSKAGSDMSFNREEHFSEVISEMLGELSKGDGVSTFEFNDSGVVSALLNYFSCGHFSKEKILNADLYKLRHQALKISKSFVTVALPSNIYEGRQAPMTVLIQKLQNALSSLECFPVVLSQSSSGISRLASGLSALSQPLKLRLCRAQVEKSLCDYSANIVLIDPMASLADVEDFLWPRVQQAETGQKPSSTCLSGITPGTAASSRSTLPPTALTRQSTRSRSSVNIGETTKNNSSHEKLPSSSSTGKGEAVLKPAQEKSRGPQTRNASRGQTALEKQPVIGVSSSEDEDMEDALVIEDDDISDDEDDLLEVDSLPIGTPNTAHDVKLSDSTEATSITRTNLPSGSSSKSAMLKGSDYVDFRGGNSSAARGQMSISATAMAELASAKEMIIIGRRDHQRSLLSGSSDPPRLIFTEGGKQLNRHLTIYQTIQRQLMVDDDNGERYNGSNVVSSDGNRLWSDIHTIIYQKAKTQSHTTSIGQPNGSTPSKSTKAGSSHRVSLLDSILQAELPCDLEKSNPTYNILALLRVLEVLNQLAPLLRVQTLSENFAEGKTPSLPELSSASGSRVPSEEFVNSKLNPKLARQIQDPLALCSGSLPSWCYQLTKACPFLFSFETRRQYFYSTSFGLSRALYHLQKQGIDGQHGPVNQRGVRVGRLQRQKVRISRTRILDSATKVMEMYCSQKAVLEIEYFGEVGTGLGPTLEFYTLLSHDLQKVCLGIWRTNSSPERASIEVEEDKQKNGKYSNVSGMGSNASEKDLVQAPLGLFPCPWPSNADASVGSQFSKVIEYFRLVGRAMAKALQDGRLLDLPMSTAFYKLVLGQTLHRYDILSIDPDFGKILQELFSLVCRKLHLESMGGNNSEAIADLRFRGVPVEDLSLDFTLPGYPDYILKPGDQNVDIYNLEEYLALIVDATVKTGITRQMEAFRAGFNQVFDVASLQIFSPHELDSLLCGCRELWKSETLVDHIKFDHGYTAKSPEVVNLLEIMGEFTPEQQRAFCQFVTGAPKLPPGGLAVLNPKLTIVRKHSSTPSTTAPDGTRLSEPADDDLPSVMTCVSYLKLPPYSTKEIMYKKLLYAISEGQGSFDLS